MKLKFISKIAAIVLAACLAAPAQAQETPKPRPEIMVRDGKAFTFQEKQKAEEKGPNTNRIIPFDIVSAWDNAEKGREPAMANCERFQTTLRGVIWCFRNERNLARFAAATDKDGNNPFVPLVGGRCTLAAALGLFDIYGDPRTARIATDKLGRKVLILHGSEKWWTTFNKERSTLLANAVSNWNMLRSPGQIVPNDKLPK